MFIGCKLSIEVEIRQPRAKGADCQETWLLVIEVSLHDVMGLQAGPQHGAWTRQIQLVDKTLSKNTVNMRLSSHRGDIRMR
jgi:hypothetical protein